MISGLLASVSFLALILYPVLIFFGLKYFNLKIVGLAASILLALRLGFFKGRSLLSFYVLIALGLSLAFNLIGLFFDWDTLYKFYPIIINFSLLTAFAHSLFGAQTIVEQLARMRNPELSIQAVEYTRRVTWIWICFFAVNGSLAAYTAVFSPVEVWTFYNGFLSYLLVGLLFFGEKIFRTIYLKTKSPS
jgi:uncharacterized membrane protein